MNSKRLALSFAFALAAVLLSQASASATQYSIKLFNPDGTPVTEKVTLQIIKSNNQTHQTIPTTTGLIVFNTKIDPVPSSDATVTFAFTRLSNTTGTPNLILSAMSIQPNSPPTKTMDLIVP